MNQEIKKKADSKPFEGKRLLVTGGTGSLGKVLVRRLLSGELGQPSKLIIFSRDEAKQHFMRMEYQNKAAATDEVIYRNFQQKLEFRIGDIRDLNSISGALAGVDIVFNAAALKQVPTCEYFPHEAVLTNIQGAENIVRAIENHRANVETVVGISTDKACKPVNVMGMTKAIQERIFIQANMRCPQTRFVRVRYGNVLASRGSVIPLFHDQIQQGGPVTITTNEMTRFLLSLDDAVDTVFAAVSGAAPGEMYVPRAPSALVTNIAKALIGDRPIKIKVTGIRPGEKIHESMVSEEEATRTVDRGKWYAVLPLLPEISGDKQYAPALKKEYSSGDIVMSLEETYALLAARSLLVEDFNIEEREDIKVRVLTVLGTRPEIIRLSLVIKLLDAHAEHILVHTGQNYDDRLSKIFFEDLDVRQPDVFMGVRAATFSGQIAQIIERSEELFLKYKPDRVLVLGDTNSGIAAITARRLGIPVYHMEAGNRCYDDRVPEEVNRRIIDHCSSILMPYTHRSKENLLREGIASERIFVIGNPIKEVIDAHKSKIAKSKILSALGLQAKKFFLVTLHRAENVDDEKRLRSFISAFSALHDKYNFPVIVSFHPRTQAKVESFSMEINKKGVQFCAPFGFFDFIQLEQSAFCVLSDSGTVQEEACLFAVPNVTLRDVTERPETLECGSNILSGADLSGILSSVALVTKTPGNWTAPAEYLVENVADSSARIILSYKLPDLAEQQWQNRKL